MSKTEVTYEDMISVILNYAMRLDEAKRKGFSPYGGENSEYLKALKSIDLLRETVETGLELKLPDYSHIIHGINSSPASDEEKVDLILKYALQDLRIIIIEYLVYSIKVREDWENIHPQRQQYIYQQLIKATNLLPEDVYN